MGIPQSVGTAVCAIWKVSWIPHIPYSFYTVYKWHVKSPSRTLHCNLTIRNGCTVRHCALPIIVVRCSHLWIFEDLWRNWWNRARKECNNTTHHVMVEIWCISYFMVPYVGYYAEQNRVNKISCYEISIFFYNFEDYIVTWLTTSRSFPTSHEDFLDSQSGLTYKNMCTYADRELSDCWNARSCETPRRNVSSKLGRVCMRFKQLRWVAY